MRHTAARAKLLRLLHESGHRFPITPQESTADADLGHIAVFGIDELQIAGQRRVPLFFGHDLEDENIHLPGNQQAQSRFVARLVEQIADQYDNPTTGTPYTKPLDAFEQRDILTRLELLQVFEHAPKLMASAQRERSSLRFFPHAADPDSVRAAQADEAQSRRQLLRIVQLRRISKVHRVARVDQRVEVEVFFFEKQFEEETVESSIEVPVDEPQVVSRDVIAKVGELDALPLPAALAFALEPAAEDFAADELETLEFVQ